MNTDNDYDEDGNNIVPCPICLSVHCPSNVGAKCPEEDEFINNMNKKQIREEWSEKQWNEKGIFFNLDSEIERANEIKELLLTTEKERIEGVIEEHKINIHAIPNDIIQRDESEGYNQALDDIIKAIKQ